MFNYIKGLFAAAIGYDNDVSGLAADNVQDAIDELAAGSVDPFALVLFDDCTPLFDNNDCENVELLTYCGPEA